MFFTAEIAEFTEKKLKNLCDLGALCGKSPYQYSMGALFKNSIVNDANRRIFLNFKKLALFVIKTHSS